jgi:pimeloyl-ACP methyl ester carboxylesterase
MKDIAAALLAAALAIASPSAHADSPNTTHRFVEVRGAKLYTESVGQGPPILFLHGGALFFDNNFAKQRDYFAANRRVVGIDQRGHGHSPDGAWALSYLQMAEDTAAVIVQLGLGRVDIVGHSDGANIALLVARDHPELVHRIVISGANLRSGLSAEQLLERSHWPPEKSAAKLQALADSLPPWFRADYAKISPDGAQHWMTLLAKCQQMWIQPVVIEPADVKRILSPVLVMAGDHDFTSIEETTEIYRALPKGQLIIVPGTGHGTFLLRPELVNLAIREFLDQPDADVPAR